jgi:hypothetical protein
VEPESEEGMSTRKRTRGIKQPKYTCYHCKFWGTQFEDVMETRPEAVCYHRVQTLPPVEVIDVNVITNWNDGCDDGEEFNILQSLDELTGKGGKDGK